MCGGRLSRFRHVNTRRRGPEGLSETTKRAEVAIELPHTVMRLTSAFQPRRLIIAAAAVGCKRQLGGYPTWSSGFAAPAATYEPAAPMRVGCSRDSHYHRNHFQCKKATADNNSGVALPGSTQKPQCLLVGPISPKSLVRLVTVPMKW